MLFYIISFCLPPVQQTAQARSTGAAAGRAKVEVSMGTELPYLVTTHGLLLL